MVARRLQLRSARSFNEKEKDLAKAGSFSLCLIFQALRHAIVTVQDAVYSCAAVESVGSV